jgi:hypothetical protein
MSKKVPKSSSHAPISRSIDILRKIWHPPSKPLAPGAWLWWFWIFFIHDNNTKKTGRCRQIMILWSVKNDPQISCNSLDIRAGKPIQPIDRSSQAPAPPTRPSSFSATSFASPNGSSPFILDGAAAAWYFDGKQMHEDFVLHRSQMMLNSKAQFLDAPGDEKTSSSFSQQGNHFITTIQTPAHSFELVARQTDHHPAVGPIHGHTPFPAGMEIEGTRIERFDLSGYEKDAKGKRKLIRGTAYFQKILLAAPPPCWYWGLYHFDDGSIATYMQVYAGRSSLAANLWPHQKLRSPRLSLKEDILVYHAPTKKVYEGHQLKIHPTRLKEKNCWRHDITGAGPGFTLTGQADAYAHACWTFKKSIGPLPARSTFQYNEYPATLQLTLTPTDGSPSITLKSGWGNMENAWGFII